MKNIKKMKENKNINLKDNNYNVKKYNVIRKKCKIKSLFCKNL